MSNLKIHKRLSISQPSFPTSPPIMMNPIDDDIVFTRGAVDAFVAKEADHITISTIKQSSPRHDDLEHISLNNSSRASDKRSLPNILVKPCSSRLSPQSRGKYTFSRTSTDSKSIHRIPFAKTEAQVVDSSPCSSRSAPSDEIQKDQDQQFKNEKQELTNTIISSLNAKMEQQTTCNQFSALDSNTFQAPHEINQNTIMVEATTREVRTSVSESKLSKNQKIASNRSSKISQCWEGHLQHIKSHSKTVNRDPRAGQVRKSHTSIVDVNSQYDFISQSPNNKLQSMAWVHRMIIPDFEDESEPNTYDQSYYFVRKKPLAPKQKVHHEKKPLKLGKTSFDLQDVQDLALDNINPKNNTVELVNLISPSISNGSKKHKNKNVAFWELKDDVIPERLFLTFELLKKQITSASNDFQQIKENRSNLKSDSFTVTHDMKFNSTDFKFKRCSLKKTTIGFTSKNPESFEQYSRRPHLICVDMDGWSKIQKRDIKVEDCMDCKSELIFDPTERMKQNPKTAITHSLELKDTFKLQIDGDSLMAIGTDIFKRSNLPKISFSDAIEMIQFIVELNRRMSNFQRIIRKKKPSPPQNPTEKVAPPDRQSKTWKAFNNSVELLKHKYPDQYSELERSQKRIPLLPQFEKIIILT